MLGDPVSRRAEQAVAYEMPTMAQDDQVVAALLRHA
jgi:hypothetical protein